MEGTREMAFPRIAEGQDPAYPWGKRRRLTSRENAGRSTYQMCGLSIRTGSSGSSQPVRRRARSSWAPIGLRTPMRSAAGLLPTFSTRWSAAIGARLSFSI